MKLENQGFFKQRTNSKVWEIHCVQAIYVWPNDGRISIDLNIYKWRTLIYGIQILRAEKLM